MNEEQQKKVSGKVWGQFKEFINRGNVMDLAVGVIIGGAFTTIVTSLVDDVIMPLVSVFTGGFDFTALCVHLGYGEHAATLKYGSFISSVINFAILAAVVFALVKILTKILPAKEEPKTTRKCPFCMEEISIEATKCPHCTSDLPKYEES